MSRTMNIPPDTATTADDPSLSVQINPNSPPISVTVTTGPVEIKDGAGGAQLAGVTAASTAPVTTQPSLVVALNPNAPSLSDGTHVATIKAASTAPVATDTAVVVALSPNSAAVTIGEVEITDGTHTATVKAPSTAAAATDTALVVAVSPNNVVKAGDGTTSLTMKAASTAAAAADPSAVVALSPNSPLPAGENHAGSMGGNTLSIRPALTVSTSAYSAGNCVGGLTDLGAIMRVAAGTGVLLNVTAVEKGTQKAALDILFFSAQPAATFTDKSAFPTLTEADALLIIAKVEVAATDYVTVGGISSAVESGGTQVLKADSGQHLWMAVNTSGTPTYAATTALSFIIGASLD